MSIECNLKALDEGRNDHVYTKNERGRFIPAYYEQQRTLSNIMYLYTDWRVEGGGRKGRKWGFASGMQDCVSLCTTTIHIRRNADLRENKHFKLTTAYCSPVLQLCYQDYVTLRYDTAYIWRYFYKQANGCKYRCKCNGTQLYLLYTMK